MMKTNECEILCIGVALIDSIVKNLDPNPVSASGYRAVSGSLHVGGEAANEALALAKLGHRPSVLCNLGQDEAGELVLHRLSEAGADTSLIRRSEHPTPVTTMFVKDDGTRQSITNQAHFYNFHPEQYLNESLRPKVLILGSLFRAPFDDPAVTEAVLRFAYDQGIPVFADTKLPNSRPCTLEEIRTSLPMITYITPNEDEARYYTGKENPEEMAELTQIIADMNKNGVDTSNFTKCFESLSEHFLINTLTIPVKTVDETIKINQYIFIKYHQFHYNTKKEQNYMFLFLSY